MATALFYQLLENEMWYTYSILLSVEQLTLFVSSSWHFWKKCRAVKIPADAFWAVYPDSFTFLKRNIFYYLNSMYKKVFTHKYNMIMSFWKHFFCYSIHTRMKRLEILRLKAIQRWGRFQTELFQDCKSLRWDK